MESQQNSATLRFEEGGRTCRGGFTLLELFVVVAIIAVLISLLLPAIQSSREGARRAQCGNNLMQMGVALASYESSHRAFPPGVVDHKGPVLLGASGYRFGWPVQLLPYLQQGPRYSRFDFRHGVNHPANDTAKLGKIQTYMCPSDPTWGRADMSYVASHHDVEAAIDADNHGVFYLNSHVRHDDLTDGPAYTIFLGEKRREQWSSWAEGSAMTLRNAGSRINSEPVPSVMSQTSQATVAQDPGIGELIEKGVVNPSQVGGFGSYHPGGANFLMGDGSLRFLREGIDASLYRSLAHRSDGNLISDGDF